MVVRDGPEVTPVPFALTSTPPAPDTSVYAILTTAAPAEQVTVKVSAPEDGARPHSNSPFPAPPFETVCKAVYDVDKESETVATVAFWQVVETIKIFPAVTLLPVARVEEVPDPTVTELEAELTATDTAPPDPPEFVRAKPLYPTR